MKAGSNAIADMLDAAIASIYRIGGELVRLANVRPGVIVMSSRCQALTLLVCLVLVAAAQPAPLDKKPSPAPNCDERPPMPPLVRLGTPRLQQEYGVAVAFSPDGKTLAIHDGLWDTGTGKKIRSLHVPEYSFPVRRLAFAPDGKVLAGQCDKQIRLWETANGKELRVLSCGNEAGLHALAFSPDGKHLAASLWDEKDKSPSIALWETATGREVRRFGGGVKPADHLAFSPDGKRLTALITQITSPVEKRPPRSGSIVMWDIARSERLFSLEKLSLGTLSPDGRLYTLQGERGEVQIYDLEKRRVLRTLETRDIRHAFSADGKLLATMNEQNIIRIWDVASGRQLRRLAGRRFEEKKDTEPGYYPFGFSPDGRFLATGSHGSDNLCGRICLWDLEKGEELLPAEDHFGTVTCMAFSADGKMLASGSVDHTVRLWDSATGRHLRCFTGHRDTVEAVAVSATGRLLASSGRDRTLRLWDTRTGRELHRINAPKEGVLSLIFSPDEKAIQWWGLHGTIHRFAVETGKRIDPLRSRRGVLHAAPLGADGLMASAALIRDDENRGPEDGEWPEDLLPPALRRLQESKAKQDREEVHPLRRIRVSADGRMAATVEYIYSAGGEQCRIRVWEVATGGLIADLGQSSGASYVPVFSRDGWGLFSGCDQGPCIAESPLRAWDLIARKPIRHFQAPIGEFSSLSVSPDGTRLAAGAADAMVYIWDVTGLFQPPTAPPLSVADLQRHGDRLGDDDAAAAYCSMYRLARSPEQAVPFLHERLRQSTPTKEQMRQLLTDLDDEQFAVREKATRELERMGPLSESALRRAREHPPSLEVRRRLDMLLEKVSGDRGRRVVLTLLRSISVLERVGTARAREALRDLSKTLPDSDVGMEAEQALRRRSSRPLLRQKASGG